MFSSDGSGESLEKLTKTKSCSSYINYRKKERNLFLQQGMVDGSASKPALRQDAGYMVEKTYHYIAPYLGAFGAFFMPQ